MDSLQSSISAFPMDLKRIQTPQSLLRDFRVDKPLQLVGQAAEFKFEYKLEPGPVIWPSLPKATPEDNQGFDSKSMAKLLGPRSGTVCAGRTGEHKHRAIPSRLQSLRAATGSLEQKLLPLLRY